MPQVETKRLGSTIQTAGVVRILCSHALAAGRRRSRGKNTAVMRIKYCAIQWTSITRNELTKTLERVHATQSTIFSALNLESTDVQSSVLIRYTPSSNPALLRVTGRYAGNLCQAILSAFFETPAILKKALVRAPDRNRCLYHPNTKKLLGSPYVDISIQLPTLGWVRTHCSGIGY